MPLCSRCPIGRLGRRGDLGESMVSKESILDTARFTNDRGEDVNGIIFRRKRNYNYVYALCLRYETRKYLRKQDV